VNFRVIWKPMKNYVNLYQEELKPLKETLSLKMLIAILLISIVTMGSGLGYIYFLGQQLELEKDVAFNERVKVQKSLSTITAMKQELQPDEELELAVLNMRQQYMNFNRFLNKLKADKERKSARFNDIMTDLSAIDVNDIWLTSIELNGELLSLEGISATESSFPKWLEKFKNQQGLATRRFAKVELKQQSDKTLKFILKAEIGNAND
jgi:Tfp pilus assembly protein PilN